MATLSVLIPAHNEEKTLRSVIESHYNLLIDSIKQGYIENFEIIVLDDGSTDATQELLRCYRNQDNIKILSNKKSEGLQRAFKKLYEATSMSWTYLTPGDGQIPSSVLKTFIFEAYKADWRVAILGKRKTKSDYSLLRRLISFIFKIYTYYILAQKIPDVGTVKLVPTLINRKEYKCSSALQEIERIQYLILLDYPIKIISIESISRIGGKSKGVSGPTLKLVLKEITFLRRLKNTSNNIQRLE
jgi:glycosyltransferase involved in cell wall biosynthesis